MRANEKGTNAHKTHRIGSAALAAGLLLSGVKKGTNGHKMDKPLPSFLRCLIASAIGPATTMDNNNREKEEQKTEYN